MTATSGNAQNVQQVAAVSQSCEWEAPRLELCVSPLPPAQTEAT